MKKIIITTIGVVAIGFAVQAQEISTQPPRKMMTKEEKEMKKIKDETDLVASFKELGLDEATQKKIREAMSEAGAKNNEIRKNDALSEEQKKTQMMDVNKTKNDKFKEILGEEKFKQWNTIRKRQKEEAMKAAEMPVKE